MLLLLLLQSNQSNTAAAVAAQYGMCLWSQHWQLLEFDLTRDNLIPPAGAPDNRFHLEKGENQYLWTTEIIIKEKGRGEVGCRQLDECA